MASMTPEQVDNQLKYFVTMQLTEQLLAKSVIDSEDYERIAALLIEKYAPVAPNPLFHRCPGQSAKRLSKSLDSSLEESKDV